MRPVALARQAQRRLGWGGAGGRSGSLSSPLDYRPALGLESLSQ